MPKTKELTQAKKDRIVAIADKANVGNLECVKTLDPKALKAAIKHIAAGVAALEKIAAIVSK